MRAQKPPSNKRLSDVCHAPSKRQILTFQCGKAGAKGGPKRKGVCRGWAQAGRQPQGAPSHLPALALRSVCC